MEGRELLEYQLDQAGKQIDACLEGMSDEAFETKPTQDGMTPAETLAHLSEAYHAFCAEAKGEKHEWGTYAVEDKSRENLTKVFHDERNAAVEAALASGEDRMQKHAYDYIVGHDNYHVGQLVHSRLKVDPNWNMYAIYGE